MKVYVAGKFTEKAAVQAVQKIVRDAGHQITCDWTVSDDTGMTGKELLDYWVKASYEDLDGVIDCKMIVIVPHWNGCGLYIELGAQLAMIRHHERVIGGPSRRRVVVIVDQSWAPRGPSHGDEAYWRTRTCFMNMPYIEYTTIENLPRLMEQAA